MCKGIKVISVLRPLEFVSAGSCSELNVDLNQVGCHTEFNTDKYEAVRDKLTVFTIVCTVHSKGPKSCNIHNSKFSKLF